MTTTPSVPMWSDDQLGDVKSFSDAMSLLNEANVSVVSTDDLGNGFTVLKEKDQLIKVPFIILDAILNRGDNGLFVSLYVVTERNEKLIVNDGSTGIRDQVRRYFARLNGRELSVDDIGSHVLKGVMVKNGLSRSDYTYDDPNTGESKNAATYYLS